MQNQPGNQPELGRLWWTANSEEDLQASLIKLTAAGAQVMSIEREVDREVIHYVFELDRARAEDILGYAPDAEEWLDTTEAEEGRTIAPGLNPRGPRG